MEKKKGFTLLELMVAMGIIAILAAMSVYGITIVQRSLRNTSRRKSLSDLNLAINQYFETTGTYPVAGAGGLVFYSDRAEINGTVAVRFTGATVAVSTALPTTSSGTQYCYAPSGAAYRLGASLEGSNWGFQLGDPNLATCSTANSVSP